MPRPAISADDGGENNDVAEIIHDAPSLSGRERPWNGDSRGAALCTASMWEKPTPPMMKMPSSAAMTRGTARAAVNSAALSAAPGRLVDKVVMMSPSALHPRAVKVARRRPVYWLAGLSRPFRLPGANGSSGIDEGQLAAYSCGGSRGLKAFALHRVPVLRPACNAGTDDGRNYRLEFAPPQARSAEAASPLTSLGAQPFSEAELTVSSKMRSEKGMR